MIHEYPIWLVLRHMRAVSPWRQRVGASALCTQGWALALFPQRTSRVSPRSKMYRARLVCRFLGLQTVVGGTDQRCCGYVWEEAP